MLERMLCVGEAGGSSVGGGELRDDFLTERGGEELSTLRSEDFIFVALRDAPTSFNTRRVPGRKEEQSRFRGLHLRFLPHCAEFCAGLSVGHDERSPITQPTAARSDTPESAPSRPRAQLDRNRVGRRREHEAATHLHRRVRVQHEPLNGRPQRPRVRRSPFPPLPLPLPPPALAPSLTTPSDAGKPTSRSSQRERVPPYDSPAPQPTNPTSTPSERPTTTCTKISNKRTNACQSLPSRNPL